MKITKKLMVAFLLMGLVPVIIISSVSQYFLKTEFEKSTHSQLSLLQQNKIEAINGFINPITSQIKLMAHNDSIQNAVINFGESITHMDTDQTDISILFQVSFSDKKEALKDYWKNQFAKKYQTDTGMPFNLEAYFSALDTTSVNAQYYYIVENPNPLGEKEKLISSQDISDYSQIHDKNQRYFIEILQELGLYDIYIVNPQGRVVYTTIKQLDFATSLATGPWKNTKLSKTWKKAQNLKSGEVIISDTSLYTPSYQAPANFMATPIFNRKTGQKLGTLMFQLSFETISGALNKREGLGKTGESFLVGPDYLMRSDSFFAPEKYGLKASLQSPEKSKLNLTSVALALSGNTGVLEEPSYLDKSLVMSSYAPLKILNLNRAIIVQKSKAEAFAGLSRLNNFIMTTIAITVILITLIGIWLSKSIATPIISISKLVNTIATKGDFSLRSSLNSQDEIGQMATNLNQMLASQQLVITEVNEVVSGLAIGEFNKRVSVAAEGDLKCLKESVNQSSDIIQITMEAIQEFIEALDEGNFKFNQADNDQIKGIYLQLINSLKENITLTDQVFTEANRAMLAVSQGNFSHCIQIESKGDLAELATNINNSISALSNAFSEISTVAQNQAQGDLTPRINGQYPGLIGDVSTAINISSASMVHALQIIASNAQQVLESSEEIAQGNLDLSDRIQQQASAVEETSIAAEKIASTVEQNSSSAADASKKAQSVHRLTLNSNKVMVILKEAMEEINESSHKISDIIVLIESIAFQTNLLALNAAVEAARAGEHGRGFAVVAGEVRNLAGKSAEAAKEIKALIEESLTKVDGGNKLTKTATNGIEEINHEVAEMTDLITEISSASAEQTLGINQVNLSIGNIDSTTQQNSALVKETAGASDALKTLAEEMQKAVSKFKIDGQNRLN